MVRVSDGIMTNCTVATEGEKITKEVGQFDGQLSVTFWLVIQNSISQHAIKEQVLGM